MQNKLTNNHSENSVLGALSVLVRRRGVRERKTLHSQMFHFEGPGSDWTSGNCRAGPLILLNTHKDREQVSEFFLLLANRGGGVVLHVCL